MEEAFLIMLYRMKNRTLSDMEEEFGIDYTVICRVFNTTIEDLVARHNHLLNDN
jgi:hypothetical protein